MKPIIKYLSEDEAVNSVGQGWESLVRRVYTCIKDMGVTVGVRQVKEKFGGLRIYTEYHDEQLEKIIIDVGKESFKICEKCGNPGSLVKKNGWYRTRCNDHMEDYIEVEGLPF